MDMYRILKKLVHLLDRLEDMVGLLVCLVLFLIGLYATVDSWLVYHHANDDSLLRFKPGAMRGKQQTSPYREIWWHG